MWDNDEESESTEEVALRLKIFFVSSTFSTYKVRRFFSYFLPCETVKTLPYLRKMGEIGILP
jgi:hypothetical protein